MGSTTRRARGEEALDALRPGELVLAGEPVADVGAGPTAALMEQQEEPVAVAGDDVA